eukprot:673054_1
MSIKELHATTTWMHLSIAFSILSVVVVSILLAIESNSFYRKYYAPKETSPKSSNETSDLDRDCVQSASDDVESQETATNIDISSSVKPKPIESSSNKRKRVFSRLHVLPLFMYIFYVMAGIISVTHRLGIGSFSDCKPCGIKGSLFAAGKVMMYLIFIYRLHAIYSNTAFEYNTKYLSIMAVFCVLYQFLAGVANLLTVSSASVQIGDETFCQCVYVMAIPGGILLADTIVSIVCCCAFIKPLKALQELKAQLGDSSDAELHRTVVKNMTLTSVAVITTMFVMIVIIALQLNGLAALDIIINSICIFLMNNEHDLWFKYLCCDGKCGSKAVETCCSTKQ